MDHQPSSAQQRTAALAHQRSAVRCGALPCGALLRSAVPCCAVLLLCCTYCFVHARNHSKYHTSYRHYSYIRFVRTTLCKHKKCTPTSAQPSYAQQRSAAPCGAVRCRALPCDAALCYLSSIQCQVSCDAPATTHRYVRVCPYSSFRFLHLIVSLGSHAFFFFAKHTRILPIQT